MATRREDPAGEVSPVGEIEREPAADRSGGKLEQTGGFVFFECLQRPEKVGV
jgi:hypothetical protein